MVKSINKQVPTDLFRPYFYFFFCINFNNNCKHTKYERYKNTVVKIEYI